MSIMSNIFGGFGGAPAAAAPTTPNPAAAPSPSTPGNIPDTTQLPSGNNPTIPAGAGGAPDTPLADFATLWESDPKQQAPANVLGNVDPAKLMKAAQGTDFAKAIPKELMAKIQAGGQEGVEASMQAMNMMSQTVYANSALATTKIVEQALQRQQAAFEAKLPSIIKQHTVSDTLRSENPMFSNPAVQPLISALEAQLAIKHPGATSSELTSMAKQYIEGVGIAFSPAKTPTAQEAAQSGEQDWSKFFE